MWKAVKCVLCGICALLVLWVGLSYIDIVSDNSKPQPHHASWNIFILATNQINKDCGSWATRY